MVLDGLFSPFLLNYLYYHFLISDFPVLLLLYARILLNDTPSPILITVL